MSKLESRIVVGLKTSVFNLSERSFNWLRLFEAESYIFSEELSSIRFVNVQFPAAVSDIVFRVIIRLLARPAMHC